MIQYDNPFDIMSDLGYMNIFDQCNWDFNIIEQWIESKAIENNTIESEKKIELTVFKNAFNRMVVDKEGYRDRLNKALRVSLMQCRKTNK